MMTDELTICARAMFESELHNFPRGRTPDWTKQPDFIQAMYVTRARACLTALSENISEKMVEAGAKAMTGAPFPSRRAKTKAIATCVAMITAAMGEGK